jgi:gamma-glutamyltranspeptidase/glutathione hydrolase
MSFRSCNLGMVVGPHPATAEAGLEMLAAGGNAIDAAVAAAFTEGVVEPAHNSVAGYGGAAVVYLAAEGRVAAVDFNTQAPAAAAEDTFEVQPHPTNVFRVKDALHRKGALSVGVPGVVAGLEELHRSWGTLPITTVLAPAIRAARDGFVCNRLTVKNLREHFDAFQEGFPGTAELLTVDGRLPEDGETVTNPELAGTLEGLAAVGLRDFYEGETAVRIVSHLQRHGGILTLEDMAAYSARHVSPTTTFYRGRELFTPPVGCGGVTSFQILHVLDGLGIDNVDPGTPEFFHVYGEALKACWRRRLHSLGDPVFTGVPETAELEMHLIAALRAEAKRGIDNPKPGAPFAPDPFGCTSHLCAADAAGNVVSLTQTHGGSFGSYVSVPGTGLILGHGMARFDPRPGWPNSIAPGKRPLHNMAPMLALREGRPVAAYGTPGGRTIVNNQAFFSLCLFAYQKSPEETLALPRLHCEEAEPFKLEERTPESVRDAVVAQGHNVEIVERNGGPASILLIGDESVQMLGAVDPRGEGLVASR